MFKKFDMLEWKQVSIPMKSNIKICALEGKELNDETIYQKLLGKLIYLTLTRRDISYAVGVLSRYMQDIKKSHLDATHALVFCTKEVKIVRC